MADKSPGKSLRKPALSLKQRRTAKRAKAIASTPTARDSRADPTAGLSAGLSRMRQNGDNRLLPVWARHFNGVSATGRKRV